MYILELNEGATRKQTLRKTQDKTLHVTHTSQTVLPLSSFLGRHSGGLSIWWWYGGVSNDRGAGEYSQTLSFGKGRAMAIGPAVQK
jgi:hypothetical protein